MQDLKKVPDPRYYHSHNNLQMSFANAQEMIRLNHQRTIIIDSSCYGMGRGVGNLCTEFLTDYINSNEMTLVPDPWY